MDTTTKPPVEAPSAVDSFQAWFKTRDPGVWLLRVGLLLLAGAGGWFIRYAVVEGWVGPVTRLVLASITAIGLVVTGDRIRAARRYLATALSTTGIALAYFVTVAAAQDLGTPPAWTLTMSLILAGATVLLAIRQRSSLVAATGLFAAAIAPGLVTEAVHLPPTYSIVILGAAGFLMHRLQWQAPLGVVSVAFTALGSVTWLAGVDEPGSLAVVLVAVWVVALATSTTFVLRQEEGIQPWRAVVPLASLLSAVGAIAAAALWLDEVQDGFRGLVIAAAMVAVVHVAVAAVVSARRFGVGLVRDLFVLAHVGVATSSAAIAVSDAWSWRSLPPVLAVSAAGIVAFGVRRGRWPLTYGGLAMLAPLLALWAWSLDSAPRAFEIELGMAGVVPLVLTVLAVGLHGSTDSTLTGASVVLGWTAAVTGTGWTVQVSDRLDPWAGVLVTLLWMLGGAVIAAAATRRRTAFGGVGLVGLAVAKLVFDDTATLDPLARVTVYAVLGACLTGAGWWALRRRSTPSVSPSTDSPAVSVAPRQEQTRI